MENISWEVITGASVNAPLAFIVWKLWTKYTEAVNHTHEHYEKEIEYLRSISNK